MKKYVRTFFPLDFSITDWASVQPFYENLLARDISSQESLRKFLVDWSELEGVLEEDGGWRYINASRNTTDVDAKERYEYFITAIEPHLAPATDQLNKKALAAKDVALLRQETRYDLFFRKIEDDLRCYREENIPIHTTIQLNARKYGVILGAMTVEVEGKELTLQQAVAHLEATDRPFRKEIYDKIQKRRLQNKEELNTLYSTLIQQRHSLAVNAGFDNFRDYSFVSMHRFDYTPQDCFTFHAAIKEEIVPLLNELAQERKEKLGLEVLQPFDHAVDIEGREPLRPFADTEELAYKVFTGLKWINPFFGNSFRTMREMKHLDLVSRKGKAPGGYNYPLDETGVPFIFMNAAATFNDVLTMFHESGHAVHSFLVHELELNTFKHCPSEIAELASMSMELLSMPSWDIFCKSKQDTARARKEHLIHAISCLPWMAAIDAFQHWVYEHPDHALEAREENWNRIFSDFSDGITDWSGYEDVKAHLWQKQLHLFEVPFYYIEYAIAQLGAIGVWKNAQENRKNAIDDYINALKLGNTESMRTIYQAAGVRLDFSREHIRSLAQFVREAWAKL
ncbi:M3 family oligoendopeptidase [Cardinium endosymbiont of Tipula unca]|uniref:M3 family oligoendopeptidase n=1 Tax=Cardinium endosymbiont of Tipula unca TaxID=3066216 RepID=UPI0030D5D357